MKYWQFQQENFRLKAENEELGKIFLFATSEFEKRNEWIKNLEEKLQLADEKIKELEKKLEEVEGKNKILLKMVFEKKIEKGIEKK